MKKNFSKFYIDKNLPYIEVRFSNSSKDYKEHVHETLSIGANLEGQRAFICKNEKYILKKNMLAVINPNTIHSCNCFNNKKNEIYMMYLKESWCLKLQQSIDNTINEFKNFSKCLIENNSLYNEFLHLNKLFFSNEFYMKKEYQLIIFLKKLFELDIKNKNNENIKNEEKIQPILKYLENNFKENITLNKLEKKFKLNSFYIIRLFNSHLSMSPHQYLLNLKINKSKELLKEGNRIIDVALECGFTDQSHFHRNFVNIVACTPKQYQLNFIQ